MSPLLLILIILLILGLGGGYYGHAVYGPSWGYSGGAVSVLVLVLIILLLAGRL